MNFRVIVNILVAVSNFAASFVLRETSTFTSYTIVLAAYVGSLLMHLGETKHNLPGLPPYNKASFALLNIDRFTAIIAALWYFAMVYHGLQINYIIGVFGLLCMFISEEHNLLWDGYKNTILNDIVNTISHILWHFCAYWLLYEAVLFEKDMANLYGRHGWEL